MMAANDYKTVLIIAGPTAVGKTELSLLVAEELNAEIISADSRQFYRYMDIGTAKVSVAERERVQHHFVDILDPNHYYSAGQFAAEARECVAQIQDRKHVAIVVGGSGLYIRALVDGIVDLPQRDTALRKRLENRLASKGFETLWDTLKNSDPEYASKLNKNDVQRLLRALEVFEQTGKPFSWWHRQQPETAGFDFRFVGLSAEREMLYARINTRTDQMLKNGLVDEVNKLQQMGYGPELNALQTVGYKEVYAFLAGQITESEMKELIARNTRRYAKRQLTWFRAEDRMEWHMVNESEELAALADTIVKSSSAG